MRFCSVRERLQNPIIRSIVAVLLVLVVFSVVFLRNNRSPSADVELTVSPPERVGGTTDDLPEFIRQEFQAGVPRSALPATLRLASTRFEPVEYEVTFGDSLFSIAEQFSIQPESLLWANESTLGGRPDILEPGMDLLVPPIDGVLYEWKTGDTLDQVARQFSVSQDAIVGWPGNEIADLANPSLNPGSLVMVPGGVGAFQQWVFPDLGGGGVSSALLGPGACTGEYASGSGSGTFIWPSGIHSIVGNDYWDGHRALDIATGEGLGIYAADSGVVLFAGWANGGYGYMVYLDHGNGYSTLYAHLSQVVATCGSQTGKGSIIGYGGSTGNSTGPHLHFEVRFQGGFLNPWQILPTP